MNGVAKERPLPEDHAERARLGLDAHTASVPADVQHRDVAGCGRGWADDPAGTGVYAVGAYEQIPLGLGTVLESRRDATVLRGLGVHEPLAVLDAGAAPDRLVAQRPVEICPLEGLANRAVRQHPAERDLAEALAGAVLDLHARRGKALG